MQREIKFRAFCKKDNAMYYDIQKGIYFDDGSNYKFNDFLKKQKGDYHEWEIMQYTGLHDKNDKEIYKGDIVEYYECSIREIEEVEFMHGCFYPVGQSDWIDNGKTHDMKIIGNKYENSGLLKNETLAGIRKSC